MSTLQSKLYQVLGQMHWLVFILNDAGREYGIGPWKKLKLVIRLLRNYRKHNPLSNRRQHLLLLEEILRVPRNVQGDVVECGCFDGSTSTVLSLACALTNRRLFVCDSFKGLPPPSEDEQYVISEQTTEYYVWEEGEFSSHGGLEAVKKNITESGNIDVCTFVEGYFEDTLADLATDSIVLVFEDADLPKSVSDCLLHLWPKLQDGCKFYCHEPWSSDVVARFYDREWWATNLDAPPPGFHGSGRGVARVYGQYVQEIGYAVKFDPQKIKEEGRKLLHMGSRGFEDAARRSHRRRSTSRDTT